MADRTPALSIRQPWAWAICNAGKTIENREWLRCNYRGPVFIHASLWPAGFKFDKTDTQAAHDAHDEANAMIEQLVSSDARRASDRITLRMLYEHRGGIVGRARIVGEVRKDPNGEWMKTAMAGVFEPLTDTDRAWWIGGFGLVLADAEPIELVECKGALGLFQVSDEVRERASSAKAVR